VSAGGERIERIRHALQQLSPESLDILDDSAAHAGHAGAREGGHFRVTLVAATFRGRSSIERHRLVYAAVSALMGRDIHALNIVARTPEESI
jgi:BolA protein